jgi:Domain of unknown function (DUF4166)
MFLFRQNLQSQVAEVAMSIQIPVKQFVQASAVRSLAAPDFCDRGARTRNKRHPQRDTRYRDLLPAEEWARLPLIVQARFMRHLEPNETKLFTGAVVKTQLSPLGRVLALLLRPLNIIPAHHGAVGPSTVVVTEGADGASQTYTRLYGRAKGAAQIVTSTKCFTARGLVEKLGHGLSMQLAISVEDRALVFSSTGYQWTAFGRTFALPRWLSPGHARIEHRDLDGQRFRFSLTLTHPWFGQLVDQAAEYVDAG